MATWQSLGIIQPSLNDWQSFALPSVGGETFRATFLNLGTSSARIWSTSALIDSLYATDESGSSLRLYPRIEKEIFYLPIPPEFKEVGLVVRYLRVKKWARYRIGRVNEPRWSLQIEEFIP